MLGFCSLTSSGNLFAASPMISKFRTTASTVFPSTKNSSKESPAVYSSILFALSTISSSKSWGDLLDITDVGFDCLVILRSYAVFGYKIYFSIEQFFQIGSQINKLDGDGLAEVNHNVNVTFWLKIGSD